MSQPKNQRVLSGVLQAVAAAILAQTLFFKFTGAEESRYIFAKLGAEPWGRLASGMAELIASVLLLMPRTAATGALISMGIMTGAIVSHWTRLGIVVLNDGGLLFALAWAVWLCGAGVLWIRRAQIPVLGFLFLPTPESQCDATEREDHFPTTR
ncbi:MAG: DoxX family protein [Verrucomicrobia bacterium]|nr:DoxX family protein [Verrucomicrobiota bacterium]